MAATPEELARIQNLETQFAAFLAGTVAAGSLSNTQKRTLLEGIVEQGFQLNYTDPIVQVGDRVWGKDPTNTIFGGDNFIATVVSVPVGAWSDSNFTDEFRY